MCRRLLLIIGATLVALALLLTTKMGRSAQDYSSAVSPADRAMEANDDRMIAEGRRTFRFVTFGDEAFWGDTLHLHQAIAGGKLGGVGPGVSPRTALSVGLKIDVDALPGGLVIALKLGQVNLDDPATTLALLELNSVVGLTGSFNNQGNLQSVGIQCALCHSTRQFLRSRHRPPPGRLGQP